MIVDIVIVPGLSLGILWFFASSSYKNFPISHMVAFIGYPRSGKTTLITSLFAEIFAQRILRGINIIPRGEETIKRVNGDIARLETGQELSATTDRDLFNYRVEMLTGRSFLSKRYKIEIGDFPGEDSENLSNKTVDWLYETKYFQWALNADVFIFVIDLEYLSDPESNAAREYKSTMEKAFRAAWQRLKEHHYDGARRLRGNPVVIAFTRADLLLAPGDSDAGNSMGDLGNRPKDYSKPAVIDPRGKAMMEKQDQVKTYFRDIIEYFGSETNRLHVIFTSVFAKGKTDGSRLGMDELARSVLPK
uniref:50S ribosome-binding GTPase n=1 Tax=Candidatus Kentrum sp. FM TaxID=2126340 RepID=A0A450TY85_9GAMM|nr:MAG: 50S ribosome-binding GTPase [Candidatus Kentron sp. FM]VFJ74573.1 MAG: 50S ribosome-binding GTPase [Candidatus Kentron sp. FM]VFK23500.1 MAG: 50S ribosome-binding GTPase [Candidatus Kentron sp. FM]